MKRGERSESILIAPLIWMALTVGLVLLNRSFEETRFGKQVQEMTYSLLQSQLGSEPGTVVVLDISGIGMKQGRPDDPGLVTDRAPLKTIMASLIGRTGKARPKAIGLDVDFSPGPRGYAASLDPELLDLLLQENEASPIPMFVGVNTSLALGPDDWLVDKKYKELASCIVVPKPEEGQSHRFMLQFLEVNYPSQAQRCDSLAAALALKSSRESHWPPEWLIKSREPAGQGSLRGSIKFLVDYSQLDSMVKATRVPSVEQTSKDIDQIDVSGKTVLLGRTYATTDTFTVPGRPERAYAGVYLHACATNTLMQGKALYQLQNSGRYLLDILISLFIFGTVVMLRKSNLLIHAFLYSCVILLVAAAVLAVFQSQLLWGFSISIMAIAAGSFRLELKRDPKRFIEARLSAVLSLCVAALLVVVAVEAVPVTHLMWDDFIILAAVVIFHPAFERITEEYITWFRTFFHPRETPPTRSHAEEKT